MSRFILFTASLLLSVSMMAQTPSSRPAHHRGESDKGKCVNAGKTECTRSDSATMNFNRAEFRQKRKEQKQTFYIEQMQLSEEQKTVFVAMYEKYEHELAASQHEMNLLRKTDTANFTDAQYNDLLSKMENVSKQQTEIRENFVKSIRERFTPQQVFKFFSCEQSYKRQLVRDFNQQHRVVKK